MRRRSALLAVLLVSHGVSGQTDTSPHTEHVVRVNGITLHDLDWGGKGSRSCF
jgi:hypothetical protein